MVEYKQVERNDEYTEYEVLVTEWKDFQGNTLTVNEPEVVGYVTNFGSKKWCFRTKSPFFTDVVATDMFKSRTEAVETSLATLKSTVQAPEEQVIDLKALRKMFPLPRIKNNKKRTRGRLIQYAPVKNKEGKVVSTKKIIHR
jgi:hypothetical protein